MSDDTRADDFPAIVANPADRDDVWMVYASYSGRRDELRLARRDAASGTWGPWNPVPGVSGDVWRPSLAFDAKGRLWVMWAQQEPFDAAFDLYARWFDGERWGRLERLTEAPEGDFDQQVARAGDGTLHLVWQGFRGGQSDIFYSRFDGDSWSPELRLSTSDANDWAPAVAVDSKGNAHVFWDTYDRGDYDVVGRVVRDGKTGSARSPSPTATSSRRGRRSPSIAQDRVWVAYEIGDRGLGQGQRQADRQEAPAWIDAQRRALDRGPRRGRRRPMDGGEARDRDAVLDGGGAARRRGRRARGAFARARRDSRSTRAAASTSWCGRSSRWRA